MRNQTKKSRKPSDWLKPLKVVLDLEVLESRVPVSEQISTIVALSSVSGAALGGRDARPPVVSATAWSVRNVPATENVSLIPAAPPSSATDGPNVSPQFVNGTGLAPNFSSGLDVDPLALPGFDSAARGSRTGSRGGTQPLMVGAEPAGAGSGAAPQVVTGSAAGSESLFASAAGPVAPDIVTPGGTAAPASQAAADSGAAGTAGPANGSALEGRNGNGGPLGPKNKDPMWVLDANNAIVILPGVTKHDFSGWTVDLRAQVSGGVASAYSWDLSQAPDAASISGTSTYNVTFTWATFTQGAAGPHSETVSVTVTTAGTPRTQNLTFSVAGTDSPAWITAGSRPTTVSTWPTVIGQDLLTCCQDSIDHQYYSIGDATGALLVDHTLPTYNSGIPPVRLSYSSTAADFTPIFIDHYTLDASQSVPSVVSAYLQILNSAGSTVLLTSSTVYYDTSKLNPGDIMEIPIQMNVGSLTANARYTYKFTVTANSTTSTPATPWTLVDSAGSIASILGTGWSVDGLQRLWPQGSSAANGAILDLGRGLSLWYGPPSGGTFQSPAGDFATLAQNGSNFQRTLPDGTKYNFDSNGRQISVVDRNGNAVTYAYDGSGKLLTITDFNNQVVTFAYSGGRVSTITDSANRVATLAYDGSNRLNSITDFSPDGVAAGPQTGLSYDSSNHILTLSDPRSNTTTFTYDSNAGRVTSLLRPDSISETFAPLQMAGIPASGTGTTTATASTSVLAAEAQAKFTDGNQNTWLNRLDWLGFGRATQETDPLGNQAVTQRDANGLPWLMTDQLARRTRDFFDGKGNPTVIALPDENQEQYTYNSFSEPLTHKEAGGQVNTYTYDANGNELSWTQPTDVNGNSPVTTMTYWSGGWRQSIKTPNGNTTSFSYDATIKNRLTQITYPVATGANPTVGYTYDGGGNVLSRTDERGKVVTTVYDRLNRLTQRKLPVDGGPAQVYTFGYDAAGNTTSAVTPLPTTYTWAFDSLNRMISATDPLNHLTTYGFDNSSNQVSVKDPLSHVWTSSYDVANHLVGMTNPLSLSTVYGVDAAGQRISESDALGHTTTYSYNSRGWLTGVTTPLGDQTTFGYNATGDRTKVVEWDHSSGVTATWNVTYDNLHRITVFQDALSHPTTYGYDLDGNLISMNGPVPESPGFIDVSRLRPDVQTGSGQTTLGYDVRDRLTSVKDPSSNQTQYKYDNAGNRISVTDPNSNTTTFTIDAQNRVIAVTNPPIAAGTGVTTYTFDAAGRLGSVTDPDSNSTTYTYDYANRLSYVKDPNNNFTTYAYDNADRLTSITDRNNHTRTFNYDNANRLLSEIWLSGGSGIWTISYGYDNADRLTSASDGNAAYTFGYDNADRLTSDSKASSAYTPAFALTYTYDGLANRTSLADNVQSNDLITYSFDADHHLTGQTWKVNNTTLGVVTLAYDSSNRLSAINRSTPTGTVVNTSVAYDSLDRVTSMVHFLGTSSTLAAYTFTYDAGSRLQTSNGPEGARSYGYDNTNQLTVVYGTNAMTIAYDLNGNRTSYGDSNGLKSYTITAGNRMTFDGTYTYAYDNEGNMLSRSAAGDVTTFVWDYRDRLIEAKRTTTVTNDVTFTYDLEDRRIAKTVNSSSTGTVFDGANGYADYNGTSWTARYLCGTAVDQLFARYVGTTVAWYLTDKLGSVRLLVDGNGNTLDSVIYDTFGNLASETNPSNGDRFKFTGREWDYEILQYNFRRRTYLPSVGRFETADPLGFSAGDANFYRFVGNGPTNAIDPTGSLRDFGDFFKQLRADADKAGDKLTRANDIADDMQNLATAIKDELELPKCSAYKLTDWWEGYEPRLRLDLFNFGEARGDVESTIKQLLADVEAGNVQFPNQFKNPKIHKEIADVVDPFKEGLANLAGKLALIWLDLDQASKMVHGAHCVGLDKWGFVEDLLEDRDVVAFDSVEILKLQKSYVADLKKLGF
jgi:RHS repeat-associated protein